jgi:hypothetical protein
MPVHCQDCNHHFLLDATTVANGISCPGCGGRQVERDQPSPTHTDGDLRDMVDPATQLDQGGNPLQEGVWAGVDGGWQPAYKRDESFASVQPKLHTMSSHNLGAYTSMEPYLPWGHQDLNDNPHRKEAFLPLVAPLVATGGRMLLGRALPMLMGMAVRGMGNHAQTAQPEQEYGGAPSVNMMASTKEAVGVNAPVESPGSVPDMVEDHDPEAVDQQEFNDRDMSPAFNNPNNDPSGGLAQDTGEDGVKQKIEFRHDGDGVGQAELLLPLIMEYMNSDKSALENPQLKALHETLEREIPDYINLAGDDDSHVKELLDAIKKGSKTAAPVYMTTPMHPGQMAMGQGQQMAMPGTHQNPVQMGGMPVSGKCVNCGSVTNADGSCPQCGAAAGANQQGNLDAINQPHLQTPGIMPSPYAQRSAADHQGPITPQQKEVFAEYLIQQGRNDEVAAMMANPAIYADEWAQYLNRGTQPPEVDPNEQPPQPQMDPSQMGQMPIPGMQMPQPTAKTATMGRCPECKSATTSPLNPDGQARCHRCGHIWDNDVVKEKMSNWIVKKAFQDNLNDAPNPVAAPAADATAPGDREQQQDSTLTWQDNSGQPLQVGQVYEMHNPGYAIPDVVKVEAVKPDSITVTMVGEYNSPSDSQDANGPAYPHEIDRSELATEGLTFNPVDSGEGDQDQSQDQAQQDGVGQTVNTEPVEQPHDSFPTHAHVEEKLPTDHCPRCNYGHITSSYQDVETVRYECYRCAAAWEVKDEDPGSELNPESRTWLNEDSSANEEIGFDPRALAMASAGQARNIQDIAKRDPRLQQIKERLNANKTAGAKFSPREQKDFIDEAGVARNADRLNLDGTHYVSAFDNSKAHPDKVNDSYLGLGV